MKKTLALSIGGAAVLFGFTTTAHGQGIPVIDAASNALQSMIQTSEAAQVAKQIDQYIVQGQQYANEVEQAKQLVQNAAGLANLNTLTNTLGVNRVLDDSRQLMSEFNSIYTTNPFSGNFAQTARSSLSSSYNLPTSKNDASSQIATMTGQDTSVNGTGFDRANRDTDQEMQHAQVLSAVNQDRDDTAQSMTDQLTAENTLGNNDVGAATQLLVAQSGTQMRQGDQQTRLQQVTADNQLQEQLRRLEGDNQRAQQELVRLQQTQDWMSGGE